MPTYRFISDYGLAKFVKKQLERKTRKQLDIHISPFWKKDRGSVYINEGTYPFLVQLYLGYRD